MSNLRIDGERLWADLMETAAIGAAAKGGICRLTLSESDRRIRGWFADRAAALGFTLTVDDMGVMFARRPGKRSDVPPIAMGSHLDTQPTGGRFDGALGVLGALEALATLAATGYETFAPIEVINWTNEEGARFSPPMLASSVFARRVSRTWADGRCDRDGVTFAAALAAIGYRGGEPCGEHPLSAFFELHIEQGPVLEAEGQAIGVVRGVQGMRWFEVTVTGREAHTGATPMHLRSNALLGAARIVERIEAIALLNAPLAVATVGSLTVRPNSPNVVPGEVELTIDIRHPDAPVLAAMEAAVHAALEEATRPLGLACRAVRIWEQAPVAFDPECVASVRHGALVSGLAWREMVSGAGHDAASIAAVAPSAMIFVPCRGGISHNEAEFTSQEQCAQGAQVLLEAVLDYDRKLAERSLAAREA